MALIGEITGSGGLTASGSVFISGSLQLSQETSDPSILENMGGAIYIKEDGGVNKFYFRNSAETVTELGSAGAAADNTWSGVNTFDGEITASSGLLFADDKKLYFGTDKDWSIEYDEDGDDDLKMAGPSLTVTTDTATFTSANATDPLVIIKNTTDDTGCARLRFVKDKGSAGAANDDVGIIQFYGDDANQDQVLFGRIRTRVAVHTNGQEGGKMQLAVASHDGELQPGLTIGDGDAEDEVDVTVGNGSASRTTIAGDMTITTIANPGSDVDKFLVSNSGVVGFRTGAELASDVGATSTTATNNFTGDVTASQGLAIPDDTLLRFGNASGGDATIEYDEDGTDELRFAGAAVTFEQAVSFDANVTLGNAATDVTTVTGQLTASNGVVVGNLENPGSDVDKFLVSNSGLIQFRTGAEVASDIGAVATSANSTFTGVITFAGDLTGSQGMTIPDDTLLRFGNASGGDATVEYDENGTDELRFAGAAVTFEQAVSFDGNVTLGLTNDDKVTVAGELTASLGMLIPDDKKLYFGDGFDASFEYDEDGTDTLLYAGSSIRISDDTKIEFGSGGDASIEYDENGTDELRFAGAAVTFEQAASFDGNVTLGLTNDDKVTVAGELTASLGMSIPDDKKLYFGTGFDWSIEYDEDGDDDLKMAGTSLTVTTDTATFTSANQDDPLVVIKNTTNHANGPRLRFVKDKGAAGAANDVAGMIEFYADDANQDQVLFGRIASQVSVHTNGQEGGLLAFQVASHDGEINNGLVITDGSAEDEIDVTIANGSASRTTISGDMAVTTIANPGSDVDKFLVSNSGVIGFRTGAEVASDIGAVATTANSTFTGVITFAGDLTGSQGMTIPDDTKLRFGNASGGDATIEYDEDGTDELRFAGAAVTFEQAVTFDGNVTLGADANDVTTVTGELTASLGMQIPDDKKLYFGNGYDWSIEYDEDGDDDLKMAGTTFTMTADTATFTSANQDDPLVIIKNTTNHANGARLRFVKDKGAAGADNDVVGMIEFYGDDDAQDQVLFGRIAVQVVDASNGAEGGGLALSVATHDGEIQNGLVLTDGSAEDEIDATIGNGVGSVTTVAGSLTVTHNVLIDSSPADESCSGITATFTAGEDLVRGEVVYFKAGDSKMWKAVATAAATSRCVAMAAEDISADAAGTFLLQGFLTDNGSFPSYTITGVLYTPEAETSSQNVPEQTAPDTDGDFVQIIGWAVTANTVYFCPDSTVIEVA
jgi:hypothetical protein